MNGNAKFIWNRGEKRRKSQAAVPISIWKRKSCFFFWKGPEEKKSCQIRKGRLRIFHAAFEGKSGRKTKRRIWKSTNSWKKRLNTSNSFCWDKYLEGLVEESLYQIKERELQNKLKNNTGSRTCRQKNRDFLAEEQEEVEKRLRETEQFLKEHHVVLKACVLCELKMVDKI